jgi:hypothetical protein
MTREETDFDVNDAGYTSNARRVRAEELVETNKGKIDIAFAKKYLSDHYDSIEKKENPNERTLCGHIDVSPRGAKPWQPEYGPAGSVQGKVADAQMVTKMAFHAALGHPCGISFKAADHLKKHPEFAWQKELLRDMKGRPWTEFQATKAQP